PGSRRGLDRRTPQQVDPDRQDENRPYEARQAQDPQQGVPVERQQQRPGSRKQRTAPDHRPDCLAPRRGDGHLRALWIELWALRPRTTEWTSRSNCSTASGVPLDSRCRRKRCGVATRSSSAASRSAAVSASTISPLSARRRAKRIWWSSTCSRSAGSRGMTIGSFPAARIWTIVAGPPWLTTPMAEESIVCISAYGTR